MKRMLLAAALALSALFTGCAATTGTTGTSVATPIQTAQAAAENFQAAVKTACNILQPTIAPFATILDASPGFSTFNGDLTLACSINSALDLTSVNSILTSSIKSAQTAVSNISTLTKENQAVINGALGLFSGALQNALDQYNSAKLAATASTAASASATVAASAGAATQ